MYTHEEQRNMCQRFCHHDHNNDHHRPDRQLHHHHRFNSVQTDTYILWKLLRTP